MAVATSDTDTTAVRSGRVLDRLRQGRLPVGPAGLVLVVAGAVLQLVALLHSVWVRGRDAGGALTRLGFDSFAALAHQGLAYAYFVWAAWLLLAMTAAVGVAACLRWRWAAAFRVAGAVLGVVAAAVTLAAAVLFAHQSDAPIYHLARDWGLGIYLAVLGQLATALGALAGGVGTEPRG